MDSFSCSVRPCSAWRRCTVQPEVLLYIRWTWLDGYRLLSTQVLPHGTGSGAAGYLLVPVGFAGLEVTSVFQFLCYLKKKIEVNWDGFDNSASQQTR
jgi:hypothetical protein